MELVGKIEERIQSAHRWDHGVVLTTDEAQTLVNAMVERDRLREAATDALPYIPAGYEAVRQRVLDALDGGDSRG